MQDGTSPDHPPVLIRHIRKFPSGGTKVQCGSHEYSAVAPGAREETVTLPQSSPVGGGGSGQGPPSSGESKRMKQ